MLNNTDKKSKNNNNSSEYEQKLQQIDSVLKLLNYVSKPAVEQAWLTGYTQAISGDDIDVNPYNTNDEEYKHWEDGWWNGFYGDSYTANILCERLAAQYQDEYKLELSDHITSSVKINHIDKLSKSSKLLELDKPSKLVKPAKKYVNKITNIISNIYNFIYKNITPIIISATIVMLGFAGLFSLLMD